MRKHEIIADSQKQTDCGRGQRATESGTALSFVVLSVSASSGVALSFFLSLRRGNPLSEAASTPSGQTQSTCSTDGYP